MRRSEIDKRFTEKVTEFTAKGYIINSDTMRGSQGEIGKVDLVKGNELIRVWLNSESDWNDKDGFYGNKIVLRVSRWTQDYNPRIDETVWMSKLTHIEEHTYYEIGRWRNKWYLDNLDEVLACQKKQNDRYVKYRSYSIELVDITSDTSKEIAANYLKNHKDYQRVSRDKIKVTKRVYLDEDSAPDYIIKYGDSQVYTLR